MDQSNLTVYVNIPFCNSKCHFCRYVAPIDTASLVDQADRYAEYVAALKRQIAHFLPRVTEAGRRVSTIYFGGGTPTALAAEELADLLHTIHEHTAGTCDGASVTVETTPENVPGYDFTALRRAGFNRVSMGAQSMEDQRLQMIGRSHRSKQVNEAVDLLIGSGFTNINVDLMFGMPNETEEELVGNLEKGIALGVNHYSIYIYEPDPRTVMARLCETPYTRLELEEKCRLVQDFMRRAGFENYNVFYFTSDGLRCDCDDVYYTLAGDWVGFGAGAHSLVDQRLYHAAADFRAFLAKPESLGHSFQAYRNPTYLYMTSTYMLCSDIGIDIDWFERRIGLSFDDALAISPELHSWHAELREAGALVQQGRRWTFVNRDAQLRYLCAHMARRFEADILKSRAFAKPYEPAGQLASG